MTERRKEKFVINEPVMVSTGKFTKGGPDASTDRLGIVDVFTQCHENVRNE